MPRSLALRTGEVRIIPFWTRIPQFFLYPFYLRPLLQLIALSLLTLAGLFLSSFGAIVWIGVGLAFLRYGYSVLERTAYGVLSPNARYASYLGRNRPWKQLLVIALYVAAIGAIGRWLGPVTGLIAAYALLLFFPANVMVLAVTDSVLASLNPTALINVILAIGWSYVVLDLFLVALSVAAEGALYVLYVGVGRHLAIVPAIAFSQMYFTLIAFNMMGYVIYQYHQALGVPLREAPPRLAGTLHERVRDVQSRPQTLEHYLQELVLDGRTQEAADLLYELMRKDPDNTELHERLHRLAHASGDAKLLARHGRLYIVLLLKQGRAVRALEVLERCRAADAVFHMPEAEQQLAVARIARGQGRDELAVALLQDFDQAYPGSHVKPEAYLLAAEILAESFDAPEEARGLLDEILRKHAAEPIGARARQYLETLARKPPRPPSASQP